MIKSKGDYLDYCEADRIALNRSKALRALLFDDIWKFERLLRGLEYVTNCRKNVVLKIIVLFLFRRLSTKLGFSIPINVFGPGLSIAHRGTIVVNPGVRVGANCRLHVCVNIGAQAGTIDAVPKIGDNCYIGPGAKIFDAISIGDNTVIGANAVVNKSFPDGNVTIGGVPARIISDNTSEGLLVKGWQQDYSSLNLRL